LPVGVCADLFLGETRAMLVLSRKKNESIVIDENIVITVVEVRGDKVRLGIQAPKEVPIHRSEIHAAIRNERAAAEQNPSNVTKAET
jgi:carbon storage regulator